MASRLPAVLAGVLFAAQGALAAESAALDVAAVRSLLGGNTLDAVTALKRFEGQPFRLHLRADGTLVIVNFDGRQDGGTWEVTADGQYCSQYAQTRKGMRKCFQVRDAGHGRFEMRTPEGELSSTFTVRKGNPDGL
ncbi:MAG: hypothetical protein H7841_09030 [Magnetospirillum sp. WYHS-4]